MFITEIITKILAIFEFLYLGKTHFASASFKVKILLSKFSTNFLFLTREKMKIFFPSENFANSKI